MEALYLLVVLEGIGCEIVKGWNCFLRGRLAHILGENLKEKEFGVKLNN
jgi:hypothetical protein